MTRRWLVLVFPLAVIGACTEPDVIGFDTTPGSNGFAPIDGGRDDAAASETGLTEYCASDECPPGTTTCPLSNFRCDVDLRTDRNNCGACGVVCPADQKGALYECVEGACVMQCKEGLADCDGVVDNGCEVSTRTDANCGTCGNKCSADEPCLQGSNGYACGCTFGEIACFNGVFFSCVDPSTNDRHCGSCENACDPAPIDVEKNTFRGCFGGGCGAVKCLPERGDCDGDASNGCETTLISNEHCGACGNACASEMECRYIQESFLSEELKCACAAGETFCQTGVKNGVSVGACYDLRSDIRSCGACGAACSTGEHCDFGICRIDCAAGTADCNGSKSDGCEVNTNADPKNCGGCGMACDGVAGQACVGGRCVVKPCDEVDAGGETTR